MLARSGFGTKCQSSSGQNDWQMVPKLMDVSQKNSKQKEGGKSDWRWSQRRLHVKWSDGTRTDETEWGIAIRGYAKAK